MNGRLFLALASLGAVLLAVLSHQFVHSRRKEFDIGRGPILRFRSNHEFTILQITDLHYGEDEEQDLHNDAIHEKLITMVGPDLVVNTGDAVSGWYAKKKSNWYKTYWERWTAPYRKLKVPYAYALGNHDREADASLEQIADLERSHEYSVFDGNRDIDPESVSNYLTHIYSSFEGAYDKIAALIWIFDTKKHCKDVVNGDGCINKAQLDWYEAMSAKHADYNVSDELIQGMAFFHVPIQEFMHLWNYEKTFGFKGENVSCPVYNTGVFSRFVKVGNIRVVGCGHDHNSNYGGTLNGIDLIYGQKTGYGSYGPNKTPRGARIYKMKEYLDLRGVIKWTYATYSIFEDGSITRPEMSRWQGSQMFQDECGEHVRATPPETQSLNN